MALTLTNKANNISTSNPTVTGSLTWAAGSRGIVAVASAAAGGSLLSGHTVTGGTVTWNSLGSVVYGSRRRVEIFLSDGTPSSGTLSILATVITDFAETQYSVDQIEGFDTGNVDDTAVTASGSSGTSLNIGDVGTIDTGDLVYAAFGMENASDGLVPATGSTAHVTREGGSNVRSLLVAFSTTDDTPGATWNTSGSSGGVAFIINVGASAQTATPAAVTVPVAVPTPSDLVAGAVVATPGPVTVPVATPAANTLETLSPAAVEVPLAIAAPSLTAGTITGTPSAVAIPLASAAPTLAAGSITGTPDAVAVPIATPAPTLSAATTGTPDAVAVVLAVGAPSLTAGVVTATPDAIAVPLAVPTPVLSAGGAVVPSPVGILFLVQAPTLVAGEGVVTPDPVTIGAVVVTPTLVISALTATPSPVAILLLGQIPVLVAGAASVTPNPVAIVLVVRTPSAGDPSTTAYGWAWGAPFDRRGSNILYANSDRMFG